MSAPRLRLTLPAGPLAMADARAALFGALWAWSEEGLVVASNENPTALEDLEWLGIEPDAMASAPRTERYVEAAEALVESGAAYPCFCTSAQYREMPAATEGPEPVVYDGRCRRLGKGDRAAMQKAGRVRRYRLALPESRPALPAPWTELRWPAADPSILELEADGRAEVVPAPAFAAAVDDRQAQASLAVFTDPQAAWQVVRVLVDRALGGEPPRTLRIPGWEGTAATISELREAGHLPASLVRALLQGIWAPAAAGDLEDLAEDFSPEALGTEAPVIDDEALRVITGQTLAELDDGELLAALVVHLTRRGYTITDFDPEWQRRFTEAARPGLQTLADAEVLAGVLTTSTVDYTRDVTRVLRRPGAAEVLDWFAATLDAVPDGDAAGWRNAIQTYRQEAASPGRALSTLRTVLTGRREGPSLPPVLALLGHERCRERLDKARRHLPE